MSIEFLQIFVAVLVALIGAIITLFSVKLQRKTETIKIMENQLSEKKYKAYADLVSMFFEVLKDVKKEKETDNEQLMEKVMDAKKEIFIYGSDEVFWKLNDWLSYCASVESNEAKLKYFLELMIAIRKDMRSNKTMITKMDLIVSIVQNKSEVERLRYLWE